MDTVQKYPQVMKVVSAYSLAGTLQCAIFSAFMEPDLSAWKLELNMDFYLIIATVHINDLISYVLLDLGFAIVNIFYFYIGYIWEHNKNKCSSEVFKNERALLRAII